MSDFHREERYIVIKRSRLTAVQETALRAHMARLGISTVESGVVENDRPEYETVGATLTDMQRRLEGAREALEKARDQFQFYADEHQVKSDAAYKAWDDACYWGNVAEQNTAHQEYHKRLAQTKTNREFVELCVNALSQLKDQTHEQG